jgi:hypothetical protein
MILALLPMFVLAGSTLAEAKSKKENMNRLLRGDYVFTTTRTCVQNEQGFGVGFDLLSPAVVRNYAGRGIIHFNGDGTGTMDINQLGISPNLVATGQMPVTENIGTCDSTYNVHPDKMFTYEAACSGTILSGYLAGETFDINGIAGVGQIDQTGRILLLSGAMETSIETINLSPSGMIFERICNRAGTAVKVHQRNDDEEDD